MSRQAGQHARCMRKRRHPNRNRARAAASRRLSINPDLKLRVYSCTECSGWHLTSQRVTDANREQP